LLVTGELDEEQLARASAAAARGEATRRERWHGVMATRKLIISKGATWDKWLDLPLPWS
jgi:hypothetical protein